MPPVTGMYGTYVDVNLGEYKILEAEKNLRKLVCILNGYMGIECIFYYVRFV